MMKRAFRDATTGVLKCWGYVSINAPGDVASEELDSFELVPGAWRWDGAAWVAYVRPPPTDAEKIAEAGARIDQDKLLRALALWCAGKFGLTPAQARAEIADIYRQL